MSDKRDIILVAFFGDKSDVRFHPNTYFYNIVRRPDSEKLVPYSGHLWLPWASWKPFLCPSRRGKPAGHRPFACAVTNTAFLTRDCVSNAVSADKALSRAIYCLLKAVILGRSIWRCVCSRLSEQTRCFGIPLWLKIMVTCCNRSSREHKSQHTFGLLARNTQMDLWSKSRSEPIICLDPHRSMASCTTKRDSVLP